MDRLQNAQSHLGLLISFTVLTVLIFIARTALQWHRPLRTPDKICNALFAYSCASNIGNIAGLMYKCTEEIAVRKKIADGAGAVEEQEELDRLLLGPHWLKMGFFIGFFYMVELWVLKGAFIAFYWGLFSKVQTRLRYLLYGTIVAVAGTFVALVVMYLCWCTPIERNWTSDLMDYQSCAYNPSTVAHTFQATFNMATDVMIMLLPLSILNTLHLGRHEKLALFFVFTVGSFSIAASIIRFTIVIRALSGSNYTLMTLRELERWSVVEFSMALLAFCLPALRGFVVRIFGAGRRSTRESSGDDARRIAGIIPPLGVVGAADAEAQWGGGGGRRKHYLDTRVSVGEYVESLGKNRSRDGRERLKSFELAVRSKSESQERLRNTN